MQVNCILKFNKNKFKKFTQNFDNISATLLNIKILVENLVDVVLFKFEIHLMFGIKNKFIFFFA